MAVDEGKFRLYTKITAPLKAGEWRLRASQNLSATTPEKSLTSSHLKVDGTDVHFRVRSPRYVLPPDQILSTYPPANSEGSYGSRLPQVVIKRRTLPWERSVAGGPKDDTPWLALVLIAEGEAKLLTGVDVAACVTSGVDLEGIADVPKGNCLEVSKSVIDKVFPTRNDVGLLAHAREVDINDTELMMGDDDGFLSVVIGNRLPLPARDSKGEAQPVKYMACLINLEGQFTRLLERSPDPESEMAFETPFIEPIEEYAVGPVIDDHRRMETVGRPAMVQQEGLNVNPGRGGGPAPMADRPKGSTSHRVKAGAAGAMGAPPSTRVSQWSALEDAKQSSQDIALQMARDFGHAQSADERDQGPKYRFPVLLHWSFTTTGSTTFRSLMENLDSRLLGDAGGKPSAHDGRLPLEVVESGHVGLNHLTREGDQVRSWYRGPLSPHPSKLNPRLPLAHASDQLRMVIPDGREDLSLATAFETGRLLTLSQPSIIAILMRWRQGHYHAARLNSMMQEQRNFWEDALGIDPNLRLEELDVIGGRAGRHLIDAIINDPEGFLGRPLPAVSPGRPLEFEGRPLDLLANGLGLNPSTLKGDLGEVLDALRNSSAPSRALVLDEIGTVNMRESLEAELDSRRLDLVSGTLSNKMIDDQLTGPAFPVTGKLKTQTIPDALDGILSNAGPAADIDEEPQ